MRRKIKRKPGWYLIVGIVSIIMLYFLFNTSRKVNDIWGLMRMKRIEERNLRRAMKLRDELIHERGRLQNDSTYIEEIARREYGMHRNGEKVYYITNPDSNTEKSDGKKH
ncbi:septum formation initiator family protein [Candidatus Latescibacterota bacterium]